MHAFNNLSIVILIDFNFLQIIILKKKLTKTSIVFTSLPLIDSGKTFDQQLYRKFALQPYITVASFIDIKIDIEILP